MPKVCDIQERIRVNQCRSGSVDLSDPFMVWSKSPLSIKARDRRFLSGNTAFNRIDDVPMHPVKDLAKVTDAVYNDIFRGVTATDTYGKKTESDEESEDFEELADPADDKKKTNLKAI